jgi:TolB protein
VQPRWSPNGKWITYWGLPEGTGKRVIYLISYPGNKPVIITNDEFINWSPTWSADGSYIYFSSSRGGSMNLWRVNVDEGSGKVLGSPEPATVPSGFGEMAKFSRNGNKIVYVSAEIRGNIYKLNFDPVSGKSVGQPVPVTEGTKQYSYPSVSPDSKWIVASSTGQQEDLYIMRSDGSGLSKLTSDIYKDRGPQWSPDGKSIAFYSDRTGKYEIWRINIDGSNLRQLTSTANTIVTPVWFPDGHLMLSNYANRNTVLFNPDSGIVKDLPSLPDYSGKGVAFYTNSISPDGKYIAGYLADLATGGSRSEGIVIYSLIQKSFLKLTNTGVGAYFFNNSKRILYIDAGNLYTVSIDTRNIQSVNDLSLNLIDAWSYAFSPDNKSIYFIKEEKESDIWMGFFK